MTLNPSYAMNANTLSSVIADLQMTRDSARRRADLLAALDLPPHVSVSALVDLLQNPAYAEKYHRYTEEEHT